MSAFRLLSVGSGRLCLVEIAGQTNWQPDAIPLCAASLLMGAAFGRRSFSNVQQLSPSPAIAVYDQT
jgi:hypothetical protein